DFFFMNGEKRRDESEHEEGESRLQRDGALCPRPSLWRILSGSVSGRDQEKWLAGRARDERVTRPIEISAVISPGRSPPQIQRLAEFFGRRGASHAGTGTHRTPVTAGREQPRPYGVGRGRVSRSATTGQPPVTGNARERDVEEN
ncbi:hypothetical protein WMY93_034241, partial [Mugilogobius chulae]